ncbi:MAG: histidinol dehydrogenase [Spirochaetales bacterium]|nr:histidinol dehydrogenase [Spirochaetales bacterium]MBO6048498.1 histidinol dehydrogenase [Spirochaetales bacterium]
MIRILEYGVVSEDRIFSRSTSSRDVSDVVSAILADVKERKDEALRDYTLRFDGAKIDSIEVSREEIEIAAKSMDKDFMDVLKKAADNIRDYHSRQKRESFVVSEKDGVVLGQKIVPVSVAGIYVPGGTAAYPSTVLMDTIPAKIAKVDQVVMVTPPSEDGKISQAVLAAAFVAGVDRVFRIGGAQAIAALAYGTETVPKADKIVGPGNIYVAEAKKEVSGIVGIDMIAGPSEILIIADGKSNPKVVAADMLSQAEHDRNASAVLITDSMTLAQKVADELEIQLNALPREGIARASIESNGKIIVASSIDQAIEISDRIAPEHLEVCVDNPFDYLDKIRNAGSVFLGRNCPEALGDYLAGPNHTLPTSGTARFSSPLSVDDFVKKYQFTYYTQKALDEVAQDIALFARREGLEAHARSALARSAYKGESL